MTSKSGSRSSGDASPAKRILLVEDHPMVLDSFQGQCQKAGYAIVHAVDKQHALKRLEELADGETFALVLIDCGLPEGRRAGVELAQELRARSAQMKIIVYTIQSPTEMPYDLVTRQLLAIGVSFLNNNPADNIYEDLDRILYFAERGYVMQSSTPAKFLGRAIAVTPDPLKEEHWGLLKLLNDRQSRKNAAAKLNISVETIPDWLQSIKQALGEQIFAQHEALRTVNRNGEDDNEFRIETEDLLIWYRENWVKYCRE